jgi:hypothetical protein
LNLLGYALPKPSSEDIGEKTPKKKRASKKVKARRRKYLLGC